MYFTCAGDSDRYVLATYVLAGEATFDNTLSEEETCNTINVNDDIYKEGLETFVLWLEANNFYIFFGRDQALFLVPSNDGNMHYVFYYLVCMHFWLGTHGDIVVSADITAILHMI